MQFIPGNGQIWVTRLQPDDPIYEFEDEEEAKDKAAELEQADTSGRKYKIQ